MAPEYLGTLDPADPLYEVLADRVVPEVKRPVFHVERLSAPGLVYRYREAQTRRTIVAKFFDPRDPDEGRVRRRKNEYRNLIRLRYLGLNMHPHYVVNPFCREERIGLAVAEEFVGGHDLDHYLHLAAHDEGDLGLRESLGRLADFLYRLHSRSARTTTAPLDEVGAYFAWVVGELQRQGLITTERVSEYLRLRDLWLVQPLMQVQATTVHGDATPTNFLFPNGDDVVAIDLERMKDADRVLDVGMVCGEIKHAFLWRTGRLDASEPFIRHFLDRYAAHFPSPEDGFREITRRVPFYMALTELRIARNLWLDWPYRKELAREARRCLRCGLRQ
jgi:aminoglycoside phosphotransferase (APT) family kinase protein